VIPNLSYYTEQEKNDAWYKGEEYALMEDECDLTSEFMDSKKPLWPGFCGRGLESWTMEGEQRKERHVQLAIDIVWQAQLDQWRQSSNTDECWEFIRSQYVQISKPCLRLAAQMARQDEDDIQSYLSSVRALEKSRRKMMGIRTGTRSSGVRGGTMSSSSHHGTRRAKMGRTASDSGNLSPAKASPRRTLSDKCSPPDFSRPTVRPILKGSPDVFNLSAGSLDTTEKATSKTGGTTTAPGKSRNKSTTTGNPSAKSSTRQFNNIDQQQPDGGDDQSRSSHHVGGGGNAKKKIEFKAGSKSKTKIPTSPVGSLCSSYAGTEDSSSTMRRMRSSHMSVASDESSRRRMLRATVPKTPL
jgi:hypothetical protein